MGEPLHMYLLRDVLHRLRAGESQRRVARDLGIARETVRKYRHLAAEHGLLAADRPLPDEGTLKTLFPEAQPVETASTIAPYRDVVEALLTQGVEMVAIHARLCQDHGYAGSYSSLRRYVSRHFPKVPQVTVRVHCEPGEEAQVDFTSAGMLFDPRNGEMRQAHLFVATLSYSRHMYAEIVFDQTVPAWIACHRNAFAFWGGVPRRIVPDNLKAAVKRAAIDDVILGDAYRRMALHYGFLVSPTRPRTPQHKGKVENSVHYVRRNFLAGREYADADVANRELRLWLVETAGARVHGTTQQRPWRLFQEHERPALLPLPSDPFTLMEIKLARVHPDCHVTLARSHYSVPYPFVGKDVELHVHERVVEIYDGLELITTHPRCTAPGQWRTRYAHYPEDKAAFLTNTPQVCRSRASRIGPATREVVDQLLAERPLDRLRSVQGILRREGVEGAKRLEAACARALCYGPVSYRRIKEILSAGLDFEPLPEREVVSVPERFAFAREVAELFSLPEEMPR
jgi:transposase